MDVSVVAIAGAGFMGSGIAESMITAGRQVLLYEPTPEPLDRARQLMSASLTKAAARGKLG
jgi:3-hydroxybutyryl-CoA dehydrogenase